MTAAPRFSAYAQALGKYHAARCRTNCLTAEGEDGDLREAEQAALVELVEARVGLQTDFLEGWKAAAAGAHGTLADNLRLLAEHTVADMRPVRELVAVAKRQSERIGRLEQEVRELAAAIVDLESGVRA